MSRREGQLDLRLLRSACRFWGIQPSYKNTDDEMVWADEDTLVSVLGSVSRSEISSNADLQRIISDRKQSYFKAIVDTVITARSNAKPTIPIHLSEDRLNQEFKITIANESDPASTKEYHATFHAADAQRRRLSGSEVFFQFKFSPPEIYPADYYKVSVSGGGTTTDSLLIVYPEFDRTVGGNRKWGAFMPLYSVREEEDWGIGDLGSLKRVQRYFSDFKADWIGLLPLFAKKPDQLGEDVSPYSPVSRLFYCEIFLDIAEIIETYNCEAAKEYTQSSDFLARVASLRELELVDYKAIYDLKRGVLELCARDFFERGFDSSKEFTEFVETRPEVYAYAEFMGQAHEGTEFHLFAQFQLHRQLWSIKQSSLQEGLPGVYFDLPVGTGRGGFDEQRYPDLFFDNLNCGAPPDPLFRGGQDWGFSPLNPRELLDQKYSFFREIIGNNMRYSTALRIDHVMGLHRIYAVPAGASAKKGVYLRYRQQDLFAILALEAEKNSVSVVGEDLGTVPKIVQRKMTEYGFFRMWVLQMEVLGSNKKLWKQLGHHEVASLNTHDMPTLAAFLDASDLEIWKSLGIMDESKIRQEKEHRPRLLAKLGPHIQKDSQGNVVPALTAQHLLIHLARCGASALMVNMEDLWGETSPQNIPGTMNEVPNWRRRHKKSLEEWRESPELTGFFKRISKEVKSDDNQTRS